MNVAPAPPPTPPAAPKVRDLTSGDRRLPIEIDGSAIYDMLLTIWVTFDEEGERGSHELGSEWFAGVEGATPADLRGEIQYLGGDGIHLWLALMGIVASAPYPHDIDSVLGWLAVIEPSELRSGLLSYKCGQETDPETIDLAAGGDDDALVQLLSQRPEASDRYRELFGLPRGELRDRMVAALRRFRSEVYHRYEEEFGPASSRAASARRAMVRGAEPEAVIEEVTNGLDYRIQPGVSRLVLVPSVILRPWAVIDQHRDTLVVAYPVADEFIDADPDAPPSWVVKLHKALADEKRLRILRRLSENPAGLDDLAEMLGLTKSTVHHHVGLLRAAGLVRVSMDKTYTLRPSVLPEAQRTLDTYLRTDSNEIRPVRSDR